MELDLVNSILSEQGVTGIVIICFVSLVFWTVKKCDKMQEKLYTIIETLSQELPMIRETLKDIEDKIDKKG